MWVISSRCGAERLNFLLTFPFQKFFVGAVLPRLKLTCEPVQPVSGCISGEVANTFGYSIYPLHRVFRATAGPRSERFEPGLQLNV
jgi:hypothetical protein